MTNNPKKHIIDAFLREIYGDKSPPDLSDEIMRKVESSDYRLKSETHINSVEPVNITSESTNKQNVNRKERGKLTIGRSWVVAATILFCVGLIGAIVKIAIDQNAQNNIAFENDNTDIQPETNELVVTDTVPKSDVKDPNQKKSIPANEKQNTQLAKGNSINQSNPSLPKKTNSTNPKSLKATPLGETIELVNNSLRQQWHVNVIQPPVLVNGKIWLERVFQKAIGRAPDLSDHNRFADYLSTTESRQQVIEILFNDEAYLREFSHFWADKFHAYLLENDTSGNTESTALKSMLRQSFYEKASLDKITRRLLTATGSSDPQAVDFDAATGFFGSIGRQSNQLTIHVSRSFMGTELQCAQCHDDSLHQQKRSDYFGINAFLQGTKINRSTGVSVISETPTKRENPGLFFEDKNGVSIYVPPTIAGKEVELNQDNPRPQLADLIIGSDQFSMVMVNWVWKEIYGYGLTREGRLNISANSPHLEMLKKLGDQLRANEFNFRVVLKWALLAESFSAGEKPNEDTLAKDIPKYGGVPFFSYSYARNNHDPVAGFEKLVTAYKQPDGLTFSGRLAISASVAPELDPDNSIDENPLTISDVPEFAKGWGVEASLVLALDKIASSTQLSFSEKVEHLYLLALSRKPTRVELAKANSLATDENASSIEPKRLLQDIWWAIYPR